MANELARNDGPILAQQRLVFTEIGMDWLRQGKRKPMAILCCRTPRVVSRRKNWEGKRWIGDGWSSLRCWVAVV